MSSCPNVNSIEWKKLTEEIGEFEAMRDFMEYDTIRTIEEVRSNKPELFTTDFVPSVESKDNLSKLVDQILPVGAKENLQYQFKIVEKITANLDKVNKLYKQIGNNDSFWNKIQKDLQIPKEQLVLLKESQGNTIEQKLASFAANYSYTVEINTAKTPRVGEKFLDREYGYELEVTEETLQNQINDGFVDNNLNTQYYHNLTVPGGTNYTENEIATSAITPSIKGHAQFATDKGIGWFRSDEQVEGGKFKEVDETGMFYEPETIDGVPTKTRRILEVQSDLFQKGRNKDILTGQSESEIDYDIMEEESFMREMGTDVDYTEKGDRIKAEQRSKNQFLQLLNKDNNWVTFFVKSIIQDSAKKGYEKVLFPSGDTASKVEGHTTLEEFKRTKELRLKQINEQLAKGEVKENFKIETRDLYSIRNVGYAFKVSNNQRNVDTSNEFKTREDAQKWIDDKNNPTYEVKINLTEDELDIYQNNLIEKEALEKELERVDREGFGALKPIYNFYENTVVNVLKKQGYNPVLITDEYGNTWNEVNLDDEQISVVALSPISFQRITDSEVLVETAENSMLKDPILLNEESQKITRGNEIINTLANRLSQQLGISPVFISEKDALELLTSVGKPYSGEPGFFYNGKAYLVIERATTETVFHEFAHPLIKAIAAENPELFKNLYDRLVSTPEGLALKEKIEAQYPEYEVDSVDFMEEVIVTALGRKANSDFKGIPQSSGFLSIIKDILYAIKQLIRKIFKGDKIKIENLNVNTTLDELAEMLASKNFVINSKVVKQSDVVSYSRDFREDMIKDLSSIELKELDMLSKRLHDLAKKGRDNKNISGILKDSMDRPDLSEIVANLRAYQTQGQRVFASKELEDKYMNSHAIAILNSLLRFEVASTRILDHFKDISNNVNDKDRLIKGYYLNRVLKDWSMFVDHAKKELYQTERFGPGNPLFDLLNRIKDKIERSKSYSDKIYTEGVSEMLIEQLLPLSEHIDEHYATIIKKYEERGVSQKLIDSYKQEYELVRLTPDKITKLLKGELGDAHALNAFLEGFMYSQDPVILGFSGYVKEKFLGMNAIFHRKYSEFINDIEDLVNKAGYKSAYSRMTMGKDMWFLDIAETDDTGAPTKMVWKYINPYKNYKSRLSYLKNNLEVAKKDLYDKNTDEANANYKRALAELEEFEERYMHRPYTDEYYKINELFKDEVGREAKSRMQNVFNKIRNINSLVTDPDEVLQNLEDAKLYWREFRQLRSLAYDDGTLKDPESMDYKVAVRLQEYKKLSAKYHEWKLRKGAFENAYLGFLRTLEDNKIYKGTEEYKLAKEKFITDNMVIKTKNEWYAERAKIFAELSKLAGDDPKQKRIVEIFSTINSILSSYKDENQEPIGTAMSEGLLARIKELEDEYESLTESEGMIKPGNLTRLEWEQYSRYKKAVDAYKSGEGEMPSIEETENFKKLKEKLKGTSGTDASVDLYEKRKLLFDKLRDLQKRVVTQDYVDKVNEFVTNNPEALEYIKKNLKIGEFKKSDVELLYLPQHLSKIMAVVPSFAKWFNENHRSKTYKKTTVYTPTRAWTHVVPVDSSYYEKTEIKDDTGKLIDILPGSPSLQYHYRTVKDSYTDEFGREIKLKTERITWLDALRDGKGMEAATINMKGEWLPRYNAADKTYINEKYDNLKASSPDKFKLLESLTRHHLEIQEDLPYDSRLDIEAERYRATQYEIVGRRSVDENLKQNPISSFFRNVRSFFSKSADDLEVGLNNDDREAYVKADLFDDEFSKIPITGMYNLENDLVSMDVITSISRYMQSSVRHKTLLDMLPVAKALQSLVQSPPDVLVQDTRKAPGLLNKLFRMGASVLAPSSGRGANIRAAAINAFIEREFEGKNVTGWGTEQGSFSKVVDTLLGASSRVFFAFNLPSALKNSLGARFQSMIEASSGGNFNWTDYGKGSAWASMVTTEISMNVYKFGKKSVNYQLVELMDPSQGRLESGIRGGRGVSQSAMSDVMDLSIMTNVRKWTELNTTLSVFGAMLLKEKIMITDANGAQTQITYDKAWEVVNGAIKLKDGIDKEYAPGGKKYNAFVKKVQGVMLKVNGAYDSFNQPMAGRYLLYRMIMFLKKFFTPLFVERFQFRLVKSGQGKLSYKVVPRYDGSSDTLAMGYYLEFLGGLKRLLTYYKFNVNSMTDAEKRAARKTLTEVGLLATINQLIIGLLFGWDPDDEDKYEKLRQKSGALPLPWVSEDPDHPFKLRGWFANHGLNLALQVEAENDSWIPLPGYGLQDYANIFKLESVGLSSTIDRYAALIQHGYNMVDYGITGNTAALYKKEAGPYVWQEEGRFKFWNTLGKSLTLSGKVVEPIKDIEGLIRRQQRTGEQ